MTNIDLLFDEIKEITGVEDIGFHKIKDGKLNPVYKSKTGELELEKWIGLHSQNPVLISNNLILQEIMNMKKTIIINDIKSDYRSTKDVTLFGLDSLMMIPLIKKDEVVGVIPIVSIGRIHNFTQEQKQKCEEIINKNLEFFMNM